MTQGSYNPWTTYEQRNRQCNVEYLLHPSAVAEVVTALLALRADQPLHLVTTRFRMQRVDVKALWTELVTGTGCQ